MITEVATLSTGNFIKVSQPSTSCSALVFLALSDDGKIIVGSETVNTSWRVVLQ